MSTAHIKAKKGDFAKTVLMPGDPLRAKWIADNFLKEVKQVNSVRGMLGFTGTYDGKKVSVMGSGMGIPTIGIYSFELFNFFDVENIIRIGSCGAYDDKIEVRDIFLATYAWSESTYHIGNGIKIIDNKIEGTKKLIDVALKEIKKSKKKVVEGTIHSSDVFYNINSPEYFMKRGVRAVEMEAFGLYVNAKRLNKNALTICTVSDNIVTGEQLSSDDRQNSFTEMIEIALKISHEL